MTFVKENDLDVVAFTCCPDDDGVSGIRRIVWSPSCNELFALKLLCGMMPLMDDFVLVEFGLGGKPLLAEFGLGDILILVDVGRVSSNALFGICNERFGRREF
jgi:hypothetical protein